MQEVATTGAAYFRDEKRRAEERGGKGSTLLIDTGGSKDEAKRWVERGFEQDKWKEVALGMSLPMGSDWPTIIRREFFLATDHVKVVVGEVQRIHGARTGDVR